MDATKVNSLFIAIALLMANGMYYCRKNGGFKAHIPFLLVWVLYFLYCFYTPLNFWVRGNLSFNDIYIGGYYTKALMIYLVGLYALTLGYRFFKGEPTIVKPLVHHNRVKVALGVIFWVFFGLVLFNIHLSGVNLLHVINPSETGDADRLFKIPFYSNYIEALTDSLIAILIAGRVFRINKAHWALQMVLALALFVLCGWRYRIVLLALGLLIDFGLNQKYGREGIKRIALVMIPAVIVLQFFLVNRWAIGKRRWDLISFDITAFNNNFLVSETNNSQAFMAVLKYKEENNIGPDWGSNLVGGLIIRATPTRLFPNQSKPLPAGLKTLYLATNPKGVSGIPALTNMEEYYTGFWWLGVIGIMTLFGAALARWPANGPQTSQRIVFLVSTVWLYQFVARGYFAQNAELAIYLALPLVLLVLIDKVSSKEASN